MLALSFNRTVEELQSTMLSSEFTRWIAFYQIRPWGARWEDIRAANQTAWIVNALRAGDKLPKDLEDYMPRIPGTRRRRQTLEEERSEWHAAAMSAKMAEQRQPGSFTRSLAAINGR